MRLKKKKGLMIEVQTSFWVTHVGYLNTKNELKGDFIKKIKRETYERISWSEHSSVCVVQSILPIINLLSYLDAKTSQTGKRRLQWLHLDNN